MCTTNLARGFVVKIMPLVRRGVNPGPNLVVVPFVLHIAHNWASQAILENVKSLTTQKNTSAKKRTSACDVRGFFHDRRE